MPRDWLKAPTPKIKPRDYQEFAIQSIIDYFAKGKLGNPVVALPTGTGKSIVIAEFLRRIFEMWPGQKVVMATHVKELIEQNYEKLMQVWSVAPSGICSSGIGKREIDRPIIFGGIQTLINVAHLLGKVDLIIIDECHLVPQTSNTSYRKFISLLKTVNPHLKVIGLTATPYRLGVGTITDGGIFTDFCCDATTMDAFNWFIDEGYLAELIPKHTNTNIDLTTVGRLGGDYKQKDLQAASDKEYITRAAVEEMLEQGHDRNHWLIFATGVDHVHNIVSILNEYNVTAVGVDGAMSKLQREENIRLFKTGEVRALVNMGVLTTGFDCPFVDLIGMLRATESPGLWVQMLGRGTRPYYADDYDLSTAEGRLAAIANSEKPNCLVLDFAGNTSRLGCINDVVLPKKKGKGGGAAPVRHCMGNFDKEGKLLAKCDTYIHASLRICPHCGMEYPPETKFTNKSSGSELIARKKKEQQCIVEVFKTDAIFFQPNPPRNGKPAFIKIAYQCGLRTFHQPLCFEHDSSFARKKSRDWWRAASGIDDGDLLPTTTDEALARFEECQTPKNIRVHVNTKYPQIMHIDYTGELDDERGKQTDILAIN